MRKRPLFRAERLRHRVRSLETKTLDPAPGARKLRVGIVFYDGGLARTTWEIEEQHYCEVARAAYEHIWPERCGREDDRNFLHCYR